MTDSLLWLDDHESALKFCRRLKDYLPNDVNAQFDGLACEANALLALNRTEEFQDKLKELNEVAQKTNLIESKIKVLIMSSAFYRDQKRYDLMFMYAKDALDLHEKSTNSKSPYAFSIYHLLAYSQISMKNIEQAEFYLNKLRQLSDPANTNNPLIKANFRIAQARLYNLKNQYQDAIPSYEDAIDALYFKEGSTFSFRQFKNLNQSLDIRELQLTKEQLKDRTYYLKLAIYSLLILAVIAAISIICLWRLTKRKRDLERFSRLDSLTRVYNRWFALDAIKKHLNGMKRLDDKVCVALIDLDYFKRINNLFGHQVGDAVLCHFARLCKYQFRNEDVFGRYGGEAFVLMLNGATQDDASAKLRALRDILNHQDLTKLGADGTLEFSCGVVEVSEKADITQVLTQCDKLLYAAKQNGRNQDICAPFRPSTRDDIL